MTAITNQAASGVASGVSDVAYVSATKTMVNGDTIFTIVGHVQLLTMFSDIMTSNDGTASTLQYSTTPVGGTPTVISGPSTSLASLAQPAIVNWQGVGVNAGIGLQGFALGVSANGEVMSDGTITLVIGVGSTTGTWRHMLRYRALEAGAYVY